MSASFTLKYYYKGFYPYFILNNKMSDIDFRDFINVLQAIVDMDKPFVFLIDTTNIQEFNTISSGWEILKWMKKNRPSLKKNLLGSAVIIKNKMVVDILNWVFEKQPPVSPNIVCTSKEEAEKFLEDRIPPEIARKT